MVAAPTLKQLLDTGEFILAPGVFEMLSARIADDMGFNALYMTGYGISVSHLGLADAGLATYSDMVGRARVIAQGTRTPLIADADTGYGGLLNVRHTVRGYEEAGVQGIQMEDQEMPKKCGHTPGKRVIPLADMLRKIEVAVNSRRSHSTLIIARTDCRASEGLDAAIARGKAFAQAGADVVFIEAPESEDEFRRIGEEIDARLFANLVPGGKSPMLSSEKLKRYGYDIAIYPSALFAAACASMKAVCAQLREHGSLIGAGIPMFDIDEMHRLVGFPEIWAFEKKYAEP